MSNSLVQVYGASGGGGGGGTPDFPESVLPYVDDEWDFRNLVEGSRFDLWEGFRSGKSLTQDAALANGNRSLVTASGIFIDPPASQAVRFANVVPNYGDSQKSMLFAMRCFPNQSSTDRLHVWRNYSLNMECRHRVSPDVSQVYYGTIKDANPPWMPAKDASMLLIFGYSVHDSQAWSIYDTSRYVGGNNGDFTGFIGSYDGSNSFNPQDSYLVGAVQASTPLTDDLTHADILEVVEYMKVRYAAY